MISTPIETLDREGVCGSWPNKKNNLFPFCIDRANWCILLCIAGFALLFISLRTNQLTGGDSEQWEREIFNGVWLRKRQMLAFFLMQVSYQALSRLLHWDAFLSIQFFSIACGVLSLFVIAKIVEDTPCPALSLCLVATCGFTRLFYGHIETYALPVLALLVLLLSIQRYMQGRGEITSVIFAFSFFAWSHLVAIFVLPVIAWLTIAHLRKSPRDSRQIVVAWLPFIMLVFLIYIADVGFGELASERSFIQVSPLSRHRFSLFSSAHFHLKWWFLWVNSGVLVFPCAYVLYRRRVPLALVVLLLCLLLFWVSWHPDAGKSDWDLFVFPSVLVAVIVATRLPTRLRWQRALALLLIVVNTAILLPTLIHSAEVGQRTRYRISLHNVPPGVSVVVNDRLFLPQTGYRLPEGGHKISIRFSHEPAIHLHRAINVTSDMVLDVQDFVSPQ